MIPFMRRLAFALLIVCSTVPTTRADTSTGDVIIRTSGNRILVLVDTILDQSVAPDGMIDQWFALETAEPPPPVFAHLEHALIVHGPTALRITTSDARYELLLRDASRSNETAAAINTTRVSGIGLSHQVRADPEADHDGGACGSGGPGSTSCSVTSGSDAYCSVMCASGYYACATGTYCRCVRN